MKTIELNLRALFPWLLTGVRKHFVRVFLAFLVGVIVGFWLGNDEKFVHVFHVSILLTPGVLK